MFGSIHRGPKQTQKRSVLARFWLRFASFERAFHRNERAFKRFSTISAVGISALLLTAAPVVSWAETTIRNVSYDPTRELYAAINAAFSKQYKATAHEDVKIIQSHGGSGKQARAVIDGQDADVVTLALAADIDAIATKGKLLDEGWQKKLPQNSAPYTSTIVFVVRKGNPKGIHDWADLIKPDVKIIVPDPKSSGGARWAYLAAYGQALKANNNSNEKAVEYITEFYKRVPILDTGARGSTVTFAQRQQGDVLVSWENEAFLTLQEFGADNFEIVSPKVSILAEPPVAVVDRNVDKKGTRGVAEAYLKYLYTAEAQEIIGKNFYRPRDVEVAKKFEKQFPKIELFTIDEVFGGWGKAQATHFADGGVFDRIYRKK